MTATGSGALQSTTTERQHRSTEKQSARQGGIYCGGRLAVVACKHMGVDRKSYARLCMAEVVTKSTPLAMNWLAWVLAWVCRSPWNVISGMPIRRANAPRSGLRRVSSHPRGRGGGYRRNPHKSPALQAWYDFEQAPLDKAVSSTAEACLPSR